MNRTKERYNKISGVYDYLQWPVEFPYHEYKKRYITI